MQMIWGFSLFMMMLAVICFKLHKKLISSLIPFSSELFSFHKIVYFLLFLWLQTCFNSNSYLPDKIYDTILIFLF